jgi:hypothetical protein
MQLAVTLLGNAQSGSWDSVSTTQPRLTFLDAYMPSTLLNSSAVAADGRIDSEVARPVEAALQ